MKRVYSVGLLLLATVWPVLAQTKPIERAKTAGNADHPPEVGGMQILVPGKAPAGQSASQRQAMRQRFRRRCAIEPTIAHLKSDFRLARNYLRGFAGDSLNLLLAAAAWNLRRWLRFWRLFFQLLILALPHQPHYRLQTA